MKYREFTCEFCGRKAIDRGNRQDAKYCSQTCNQKSYFCRKRNEQKVVMYCKYNDGVCCDSTNCDNCGWNPVVEKKRIREMMV